MEWIDAVMANFSRGGPVMWVLLAVSMAGSVFAVERAMAYTRRKQVPEDLAERLRAALGEGGVAAGRALLATDASALARLMDALLARSGASRRELENVLDEEAGRRLFDLRLNLRLVGLVASLAPMLGLLGTVFGLIAAFRQAAELGMDNPANFAAGIYESLYTTAFGLVIAIPFLVVYHALKGKLERLMRAAEDEALRFVLAAARPRGAPPPVEHDAASKAA